MPAAPRKAPQVVLDTGVVLSALVFRDGVVAKLRGGWQSGEYLPLASGATIAELIRVLAYPKFRLRPQEREELLADYLPWCRVIELPDPPPRIPACRDPGDACFLHLAVAADAGYLVTGDRDLLILDGKLASPILAPAAFLARLTRT